MDELWEKYEALIGLLHATGSVAVAYSGGVDSTLLMRAARDALGERAAAVTAVMCAVPRRERAEAAAWCAANGIAQVEVEVDVLAVAGFAQNPPERCYHCKRALFGEMLRVARERGLGALVEGSNVDDAGDYRPGMVALRELGVRSPLREAGLTKAEIRALSKALGLPVWDKPSAACLASRFAYGTEITREKLLRVERAEECLHEMGFRQCRVRVHGNLARVEVPPEGFAALLAGREEFCAELKKLGFTYVTLDLTGFRSGSMNEALGR